MKYSARLSDAIHIIIYIAVNGEADLSSTAIAKSICTHPSCVRQFMMKLKTAGIISSVSGHAKPTLAKSASEITLLDVYRAVEGDTPLLHVDSSVNSECGCGVSIQSALSEYYGIIQAAAEEKMAQITLDDILNMYHDKLAINKEYTRDY